MRTTTFGGVVAVLLLASPARAGQPDGEAEKARLAVARAEADAKRVRGLVGRAASQQDLENAELTLAEAQIKLALVEKRHPEAAEHVKRVVELHGQRLKRLQAANQAVSANDLDEARIDLAEAQIRQGLFAIVAVRERQVQRVSKLQKQGAASKDDVESARGQLDEALKRLGQYEGKP